MYLCCVSAPRPSVAFPILFWESSASIIAKIAGPGRKRHTSDSDPSSGSDSGDGRPVSAKCLKMASSGVAGSETVGRRRGGRDNSSDLPSSTSKKKQKDRANQESREAKRAAAAAAVDGVIAEVKRGKWDYKLYY